jgi:8-oxo-dGTP diphosphatase
MVNFMFDGGQLTDEHRIHVDHGELETSGLHDPEQCRHLLPPRVASRIDEALTARTKGTTIYLLNGRRPNTAKPRSVHPPSG